MSASVVFCDFDGTITLNDNIIAIMKHFQPSGWEAILAQLLARQITIQNAVSQMFVLLPSSCKNEMIQFAADNMVIRPGFAEFLAYCQAENIEFLVTSGGIDFFVYPALIHYGLKPQQIYCNQSDFTGPRIKIQWPHPCGTECSLGCGMCKPTIMNKYPPGQFKRILIGDSITDFAGATLAEIIFARSHLAIQCTNLHKPYYPYENFYDIIAQMRSVH